MDWKMWTRPAFFLTLLVLLLLNALLDELTGVDTWGNRGDPLAVHFVSFAITLAQVALASGVDIWWQKRKR